MLFNFATDPVDETYIKVKGKWKYLYRAVDSQGYTIDFMLSSTRDIVAAKKFFKQAISNSATKPKGCIAK